MLETAGERNSHEKIRYRRYAMEDLDFPKESFDVVISSLAFHYVKDFEALAEKISQWIAPSYDADRGGGKGLTKGGAECWKTM